MPRTSDTYQRTFEVADALMEQGIRPTQQKVREKLGSGSISTINKALGDWWQQLGQRLRDQRTVPGLPDPVAETASKLWQQALGYAERSYKEQSEAFARQVQQQSDAALEQARQARSDADGLRNQNERLLRENAELLTERREQQDQIRQLEEQLIQLNAKDAEQQRELKQQALILERGQAPASASALPEGEGLLQLKVELKVREHRITELQARVAQLEDENRTLRDQRIDAEQAAIKKQHALELVIAQQDVRYEELQRELSRYRESIAVRP
ncbi:DNA-binding protein [Marinobacterium arenosum]|uniref:DNA-binding protein n=1 Tax=Marinobacterium arenosum TaxID=2862496 RepID=UPI001C93C58D|nr:DNA-binding protein [Marinobacterium arenosum]MBY4677216.1 DNA-binding protein [Marinobacterium arenosum]